MDWIAKNSGCCLFYTVNEEELQRIKNDKNFFFDKNFLKQIVNSKGEHCHIFGLYHRGDLSEIIQEMSKLLTQFKSVSWWDREEETFYIKER